MLQIFLKDAILSSLVFFIKNVFSPFCRGWWGRISPLRVWGPPRRAEGPAAHMLPVTLCPALGWTTANSVLSEGPSRRSRPGPTLTQSCSPSVLPACRLPAGSPRWPRPPGADQSFVPALHCLSPRSCWSPQSCRKLVRPGLSPSPLCSLGFSSLCFVLWVAEAGTCSPFPE